MRIKAGVAFWDRHADTIRTASENTGARGDHRRHHRRGTIYGRNTGNFQAVSALATLAFDYPAPGRALPGRTRILLLMAREQHRDPLGLPGLLRRRPRPAAVSAEQRAQLCGGF